jgi:hypothetical protein
MGFFNKLNNLFRMNSDLMPPGKELKLTLEKGERNGMARVVSCKQESVGVITLDFEAQFNFKGKIKLRLLTYNMITVRKADGSKESSFLSDSPVHLVYDIPAEVMDTLMTALVEYEVQDENGSTVFNGKTMLS